MASVSPHTALVTGAAKRLGRAIALELARVGHDVIVHYNTSAIAARQTMEDIVALGRRAWLVQGDLADPVAARQIIDSVQRQAGHLDVLINNASVFEPMALAEFDAQAWQRIMQINLAAPLQLCAAARSLMTTGCVINLSDTTVRQPPERFLAYGPSKAGIEYATRALARALAPDIRVNAVAPGLAAFPDDYPVDVRETLVQKVPARRAGAPQDIASAVRFLVEMPYITGQVLRVDGGWT